MINIRRYLSDDLDQVVEIWHASKRQAFPYVSVQQTYTIDEDRTHFREVISKECRVWLAEKDGKILGVIAIQDDLIDQLFIKVGEQRKGIGSQLVESVQVDVDLPAGGVAHRHAVFGDAGLLAVNRVGHGLLLSGLILNIGVG